MKRPSGRELVLMAQISRAITLGHFDRAYVLLTEKLCSAGVAAAFLLKSGAKLEQLPRPALRALDDLVATNDLAASA